MVIKAGTILINKHDIGLIYRSNHDDYSFPKGHVEEGETTLECAIRETNEETKRDIVVLDDKPIYVENYKDSKGNDCNCEYFLAKDNGTSDNTSTDTHDLIWTDFDKVSSVLSYDSLRKLWSEIKDKVEKHLED